MIRRPARDRPATPTRRTGPDLSARADRDPHGFRLRAATAGPVVIGHAHHDDPGLHARKDDAVQHEEHRGRQPTARDIGDKVAKSTDIKAQDKAGEDGLQGKPDGRMKHVKPHDARQVRE